MQFSHKSKFVILFLLPVSLVIFILCAEILLRVFSFGPFQNKISQCHLKEPRNKFFISETSLGFALKPGLRDSLILSPRLAFWARHDSNGFRMMNEEPSKKTGWILGCSFAYGWGVENQSGFPYLLGKKCTDWNIRNFGVPGYGTLQSKILLERLFSQQDSLPGWVVLTYASFHDQRNTGSPFWLSSILSENILENFSIPVVRTPGGTPKMISINYQPLWLSGYSAIVNSVNSLKMKKEDGSFQKEAVTNEILLQTAELCKRNSIPFAVAILDSTPRSAEVKKLMERNHIASAWVNVDLDAPGMNMMPDDSHPSNAAHQIFAQKLFEFLDHSGWLKTK